MSSGWSPAFFVGRSACLIDEMASLREVVLHLWIRFVC